MKCLSRKRLIIAGVILTLHSLSVAVMSEEIKEEAATAQKTLRLEDLEQLAMENNPTLLQAVAVLKAAEGRKLQAGLYPNPRIGYEGEEISTRDPSERARHSFFAEQRIVTAGKLTYNRNVFMQEEEQAEAAQEAQRLRVMNDVRLAYGRTLEAQKIVELRQELTRIADEAVDISTQLYNVGQADRPDVLEAEAVAKKAELDLLSAKSQLKFQWGLLAAVIGKPDLPQAQLADNLGAEIPELEQGAVMERLLRDSPEVKIARAKIDRAEESLKLARAERYPDITVRAGYSYARESEGKESQFLVGVSIPLPLFDRNQGTIASRLAELNRAKEESRRLELILRGRLASAFNQYATSRHSVEQYRDAIIPRAQNAYDLYLKRFRQMAAAYPQVLIAQRNLFQARVEYVQNLASLWQSITKIQGLLVAGGLDAPPMN